MARRGKYKNPVRQSCCNKGMERQILAEFRVHLAPHASDHLPIVLHTQKFEKNSRQGRRGFKFEESWLLWEECEAIVKEAWTLEHNGGHGLAGIKQKIQNCGDQLRAWGFSKARSNNEDIK